MPHEKDRAGLGTDAAQQHTPDTDTIPHQGMDFAVCREYLVALFGDTTGYLHVDIGHGPHLTDDGKYDYTRFEQRVYEYPGEADAAIRDMLTAAPDSDVFVCTCLMRGRTRAKGAAVERTRPHADVDHGRIDPDKVRAVNGFAIASGTPGNAHVYVEVTESLTVTEYPIMCRALGDYLGGADAKISDNDILRPAGTFNHKAAAAGAQPTPVEWLIPPPGVRHDKHALASQLGVTLPEPGEEPWRHHNTADGPTEMQFHNGTASQTSEPVDLANYPFVQIALDHNSGDRSVDTMRIVGECYNNGLTLPQTRWVVGTRADLAERLDEFAKRREPRDDVLDCWLKAINKRQAQVNENTDWVKNTAANNSDHAADQPKPAGRADSADMPDVKTQEHHHGQIRIAYRLARRYGGRLLYVHGLGWFHWDGKRWAEDNRGVAIRYVVNVIAAALAESAKLGGDDGKYLRKDATSCESAAGTQGVLNVARALAPFAATVDDLDADPWLLNCANGTLDLRTMQLSPNNPADRITKITRAAYDPAASGVVWAAFLARVLPDEQVREYLQRLAGVALLGKVIEHILPILLGRGRNGKGTFYEALCYALGDYAGAADPELFTQREGAHPAGQMDLLGKRLVVVSESDKGRRLAEATMKRLTGGDRINARHMHKNFVEFAPSHLAMLITNHLPKVSDDSPAIWARLRVIPFNVEIPEDERDTGLADALQAEADAILNWALAGWQQYQKRRLDAPPAVVQATGDYQKDSDDVGRFIDEECHVTPAVKITAGELFDAWNRWRKSDGAAEISKTAFGKALGRRGYQSTDSNGKRWWLGLCVLKSEEQ
jgi:putative DNA primase/helicase